MIRILLRLLFWWLLGDPDKVQQDETTWPTWLVALLILLLIGALIGGYFWLAANKH